MKMEVDQNDLIPLIESQPEIAKDIQGIANLSLRYMFFVCKSKGSKELKKEIKESNSKNLWEW